METFWKWFAGSWVGAAIRVALGFILSTAVAEFVKVGRFDFSNWESWLVGAVAIATPVILRALNPEDKAFGFVAK